MTISSKTTLAIVSMGFLLTLVITLLQVRLVYTEFEQLERHYAGVNLERVTNRFDLALHTVDFTLYDWSAWSDTYHFAGDQNEQYIESNLYPYTFYNYGTDVVAFVDDELSVLWAAIYEFLPEYEIHDQTSTYLPDVHDFIRTHAPLIDLELDLDDQVHSGVFQLGEYPVLYSMRPIVTSSSGGQVAPNGYMLLGKRLTGDVLASFAEQASVAFDMGELETAPAVPDNGVYQITERGSNELIASTVYAPGHSGQFPLSAYFPRDISQSGLKTIVEVIVSFVVISLIVGLITWWILRKSVIKPILQLKTDMLQVSESNDYSLRSKLCSADELGLLAQQFNSLLERVEGSRVELSDLNQKLENEHERLRHTHKALKKANWELKSLSDKDALTGLYNRRALDRKLDNEWKFLGRNQLPLSILMVDVDLFKKYNDYYGHQAGDVCLTRIALVMESVIQRSSDMAARYGGEEFMVVLSGTNEEDAMTLANRILEGVQQEQIEHVFNTDSGVITVSIGVASTIPGEDVDLSSLIKAADQALYRAKEQGRACIKTGKVV